MPDQRPKASKKRPRSRSTAPRGRRRSGADRPLIGWREWVRIPAFAEEPIKAKIDTGAVTSSLHALDLELVPGPGGGTVARFGLQPHQGSHAPVVQVVVPVVGFRKVRSSNGQTELRPVVCTEIDIGDHGFEIELTLASRDSMGFRMLLGRRAIKSRFLVDPSRSFLQDWTAPVKEHSA